MAIVEIISEAKCKHCKHFKSERIIKKDGTLSFRRKYFCGIPDVSGRNWNLTMKNKVCDKWEL